MKIEIVDRERLCVLDVGKAHAFKYSARGWPLQRHCSNLVGFVDNGGVKSKGAFVQPGCAGTTTIQNELVVG